jgi:hypothetical protein
MEELKHIYYLENLFSDCVAASLIASSPSFWRERIRGEGGAHRFALTPARSQKWEREIIYAV